MANTDRNFRAEIDAAIGMVGGARTWKSALKAFDKLVKAYPDEMQPRFERAMVLLNLDRDKEALVDLEVVLARQPDFPGAKKWYASTQAGQGKPLLAAEAKLDELIGFAAEHWAANGQAWADCASYFIEGGEPGRALAALDVYFAGYEAKQKGYEVYLPAPHRMRATALLALNQPKAALEAAERACSYSTSVPADKFVRLRALAALGETQRALAEFAVLKPDYEGTLPYNEAVAGLRKLGIDPG